MAAKTALGLKDLNVPAAVAGHKLYASHAQKNPKLSSRQILNKLPPNASANFLKLTSSIPSQMLDVPMSQFRSTIQKLRQIQGLTKQLNNSVEILDIEQISESVLEESYIPPQMLVLKRTGIRIFPDGRRVALYVNDKLGLVFTVPYQPTGDVSQVIANVTTEETEINEENIEENIEHIKNISRKGEAKEIKFLDGTSVKVDPHTAKAIHLVHDALNDENKAKVTKMLTQSKGQFSKVAEFAHKNVAYRIGKQS